VSASPAALIFCFASDLLSICPYLLKKVILSKIPVTVPLSEGPSYEGPMGRTSLARLAALRDENPKKLMRLLRQEWSVIKTALQRGHTLRVVHARLLEDGVEMSFDLLGVTSAGCVVRRQPGN
jgi:hypothetical protein